jgi:hypothetical protein
MIRLVVIGRKWFDKHYGNTYHKVYILDTLTGVWHTSEIEYGYGKQYRQTAYNLAKEHFQFQGDYLEFIHDPAIEFFVSDVARKRDL